MCKMAQCVLLVLYLGGTLDAKVAPKATHLLGWPMQGQVITGKNWWKLPVGTMSPVHSTGLTI